jgi:hypothetical protein
MKSLFRLGLIVLAVSVAVSGCALRWPEWNSAPNDPEIAVQTPDADTIRPRTRSVTLFSPVLDASLPAARTPAALDRTSAAARAEAVAPVSTNGAELGETLASLGSPAEQGFWLRTGLVDSPRMGRVQMEGGASVQVELRPSGGEASAGSQLSLAAFRALEAPLTSLPRLTVYAR